MGGGALLADVGVLVSSWFPPWSEVCSFIDFFDFFRSKDDRFVDDFDFFGLWFSFFSSKETPPISRASSLWPISDLRDTELSAFLCIFGRLSSLLRGTRLGCGGLLTCRSPRGF